MIVESVIETTYDSWMCSRIRIWSRRRTLSYFDIGYQAYVGSNELGHIWLNLVTKHM